MQVSSEKIISHRITLLLETEDIAAIDNGMRSVSDALELISNVPMETRDDLLFVKQLLQQILGKTLR